MKTKVYFGVLFRIIIVFIIPILLSFLIENMHGFFGDKVVIEKSKGVFIDDGYSWGARHYWFFWMSFLIWTLSVINAIVGARKLILQYYKL